jgi:hypothetical protein
MTREEAERQCERLAKESPERETHRWVPHQQADGGWTVAKIGLPPNKLEGTPETRAEEKPPTPDDPRSGTSRDVPGYGF